MKKEGERVVGNAGWGQPAYKGKRVWVWAVVFECGRGALTPHAVQGTCARGLSGVGALRLQGEAGLVWAG